MTEAHQDEVPAGIDAAPPDNSDQAITEQLNTLKSEDSQTRLAAVTALGALDTGNEASLRALERMAGQDDSRPVREAALQALEATVYRNLQRSSNRLTGPVRERILAEIDRWAADGLITAHTARLLTQRYQFAEPPTPKAPAAEPAEPRPSLSELLLSETTIKVALYLGAFFVVADAFSLAAIFEVARLPILGLATLGFFGAAVALKWRLPQASFVLFIVFSFLLPIDAAVLFDLLNLSSKIEQPAWIIVTVFLTLIWLGGTLFYASRFFSVVALAALSAAALQLGRWFDLTPHLDMLLLEFSTVAALVGAQVLSLWRDKDKVRWQHKTFALPLFGLAQLQQLGVLGMSAIFILITVVDQNLPATAWWIAIAATWFLGAMFYVTSQWMTSFGLFSLLAVAAVLPVPLLFSGVFSPSTLIFAIIACAWGVGLALAGEGLSRVQAASPRAYALCLIGGSAILFGVATIVGLTDRVATGLAILIVTTLVYLGMTILQPRWWLWTGTLLAGTAAYFTVFFLPSLESFDFYPGFVMLWPSLVLLAINLIARRHFHASKFWHLPPLILGVIYGGLTFFFLIVSGGDEPARAAIAFIIIAAFLTLFSLLDQRPRVGYGVTINLALAVIFGLVYFEQEQWVTPLIILAALYFFGSFVLARVSSRDQWASVLRWSGLALGALVAATAPIQGGAAAVIGMALAATFFVIEGFRQKNIWLGFPATSLYLGAYFVLLIELDISQPQVYSIGAALLGFIMHYLLVRSRSNWAAFFTGLISQLILLGTTYIQMAGTGRFLFFFVLFVQSLVVLTYGLVIRSKSLTIAPVIFVVLGVITATLSVLAGIPALILVGCTGLLLLVLGSVALIMREQLLSVTSRLGERLGGWQA
jgi:hypothetical protein